LSTSLSRILISVISSVLIRLLRVVVGREKTIRLYGPQGFIEHIQHKLHGYRWNLVDRYVSDLVFLVTEIDCSLKIRTACFRLKKAFPQEATACSPAPD